ncbi:MAG: hypothetical protein ABIZ95_20770, partial [Pyrinomonadaceae bacterium]
MDSESNNQIDQLLRRQGRNAETLPIAENGGGAGFVHLDADELNAFASNALPTAARMRYAGHLADCAECRRQMTQVALAVNPSSVHLEAAATAAPASSLWQKLAYFIKPPTLRYTGPILAVLCVAVIMGVVLRSQYGNRMLNEQTEVKSVPDSNKAPAPVAPNANVPANVPVTPGTEATPAASPTTGTTTPGENQNGPVSITPVAPEGKTDAKERTPDAAPVVTSAPPAPPKDVDSPDPVMKRKAEDRREKSADEVAKPNTGTRTEGRIAEQKQEVGQTTGGVVAGNDGRNRSYPPPAAKKTGAPAKGGPSRSQTQDQVSNQRDDGRSTPNDTTLSTNQPSAENRESTKSTGSGGAAAARTVSGRQFRRQGNVWVDAAYGGGATTVVNRGSDQYRGLVADEPGLRAVAEQLPGEVVVVWKGRAYRIK